MLLLRQDLLIKDPALALPSKKESTLGQLNKFHALKKLFPINLPIVQAGMVWASGAKLASACANEGALGLIGAGSMKPELLQQHIQKAKSLTSAPERLGVNVPLLYERSKEQIDVALKEDINIFFTSAGSPKKYTQYLKDHGAKVIHVTSSPDLAIKCENAGVDGVVAEGFEAGGHNGRDETTTMALIPSVVDAVSIPVIAAGGIGNGRQILAALSLGASGVQMGTRFLMSNESSAHKSYKKLLSQTRAGDTELVMKQHVPVRLVKNQFYEEIKVLENKGANTSVIIEHLGKGRAKAGMLEGDLENGELEAGQICGQIEKIQSVKEIFLEINQEFDAIYNALKLG